MNSSAVLLSMFSCSFARLPCLRKIAFIPKCGNIFLNIKFSSSLPKCFQVDHLRDSNDKNDHINNNTDNIIKFNSDNKNNNNNNNNNNSNNNNYNYNNYNNYNYSNSNYYSKIDSCNYNQSSDNLNINYELCKNVKNVNSLNNKFDINKNNIELNLSSIPSKSSLQSSSLPSFNYDNLPQPRKLPLFGTVLHQIASGGSSYFHEYCDKRHKELGRIYRETLGKEDLVFIADSKLMQKVYLNEGKYPTHFIPEAWTIYNKIRGIKRGLFFMEGEEWEEKRKSLNKILLRPTIISEYSENFNDVVSDLLNKWDNMINSNVNGYIIIKNLERELYNWSIESLGSMIFSRRVGCVLSSEEKFMESSKMDQIHEFVHWVQQLFVESAKMTTMPAKVAHRLNLPVWKRFMNAADQALNLARKYVEANVRVMKKSNTDLNCHGILNLMLRQEKIEEEEVVRIITDLFLAAADTTSHATQWALYLLAKNPDCQLRLLEEVVNLVGPNGYVQEKHLKHMPYVKGVIKESLRLYPIAPFLTRRLEKDLNLGGYHIPEGKLVVMSIYTTGRDEEYFPDANKFKPERWIRNCQQEIVNTHACLPFGLGVRSCIGRRIAEMQMQFLLSRLHVLYDRILTASFDKPGKKSSQLFRSVRR